MPNILQRNKQPQGHSSVPNAQFDGESSLGSDPFETPDSIDIFMSAEASLEMPRAVYVIAVNEDGGPASEQVMDAELIEVSPTQMRFELESHHTFPSPRVLLALADACGDLAFVAAVLDLNCTATGNGCVARTARFATGADDFLDPQNLVPKLNPVSFHYEHALSATDRQAWVDLGVLTTVVLDRVLLCPVCEGTATFRHGCRGCGSISAATSRSIHHFACAYVGSVREFDQEDGLVCPKCHVRGLVAGTDFETFDGPFECQECEWVDAELGMVGGCLACDMRFPQDIAKECELVGYDVNRLDPLAFVDAG